jgi:hypothetical protein
MGHLITRGDKLGKMELLAGQKHFYNIQHVIVVKCFREFSKSCHLHGEKLKSRACIGRSQAHVGSTVGAHKVGGSGDSNEVVRSRICTIPNMENNVKAAFATTFAMGMGIKIRMSQTFVVYHGTTNNTLVNKSDCVIDRLCANLASSFRIQKSFTE